MSVKDEKRMATSYQQRWGWCNGYEHNGNLLSRTSEKRGDLRESNVGAHGGGREKERVGMVRAREIKI